MKNFRHILLFGAILLSGCSKLTADQDLRISLGIGIGNIDAETKSVSVAEEFSQSMISSQKKFIPALWFSKTAGVFKSAGDNPSDMFPCHTTGEFENTSPKYIKHNGTDLIYPTTGDDKTIYCVGFYPSTGWEVSNDGTTAYHCVDGSDDLMFAPIMEGSWTNRFETQTYNHLLTWIKINVCATTSETARQWGSITTVEVETADQVYINLSSGDISYSHSVEPIDGESNANYIQSYHNPEGKELSLTSSQVGSIFCSPATSYNIKITMKDGVSRTVTVPLKDLDGINLSDAEQSIGKLYIINLYFKPFDIVEGKSSLYYWNNKNEELYLQ